MRNSLAALSLASLLLAACSGGGGGGGMAAAPAPAAPAPVVTPPGAPVNLQAASTRVAYPAAAVTGVVTSTAPGSVITSASSQGATITLGTDASGKLNALIFNLPGLSVQYPAPLTSLSSPLSLDSIASALNDNLGPGNSLGAVLSQAAAGQILSASSYGLWLHTDDSNTAQAGSFAFGNLTPAASVPVTGSATFNGFAIGTASTLNGGSLYAVQGNAQIIANFATQSVTTNLTNLAVGNQPYAPAATITSLPNLSGTSAMTGNSYAGTISGGALSGTINGNFYGPAAQETAGVWQASGGGNQWIGSFGAK